MQDEDLLQFWMRLGTDCWLQTVLQGSGLLALCSSNFVSVWNCPCCKSKRESDPDEKRKAGQHIFDEMKLKS